jgi:hypothetical protein
MMNGRLGIVNTGRVSEDTAMRQVIASLIEKLGNSSRKRVVILRVRDSTAFGMALKSSYNYRNG